MGAYRAGSPRRASPAWCRRFGDVRRRDVHIAAPVRMASANAQRFRPRRPCDYLGRGTRAVLIASSCAYLKAGESRARSQPHGAASWVQSRAEKGGPHRQPRHRWQADQGQEAACSGRYASCCCTASSTAAAAAGSRRRSRAAGDLVPSVSQLPVFHRVRPRSCFRREGPRRWVVAPGSTAAVDRNALAFIKLASIRLMLRKLCTPRHHSQHGSSVGVPSAVTICGTRHEPDAPTARDYHRKRCRLAITFGRRSGFEGDPNFAEEAAPYQAPATPARASRMFLTSCSPASSSPTPSFRRHRGGRSHRSSPHPAQPDPPPATFTPSPYMVPSLRTMMSPPTPSASSCGPNVSFRRQVALHIDRRLGSSRTRHDAVAESCRRCAPREAQ